MTHLLIDGDEYLFKATAAVEHEVRWDDQNHVLFSNEVKAWSVFTDMIDRLVERFRPDMLLLAFGSQPYFRTEIEPNYKAGRGRKPLCYASLREMCDKRYKTSTRPGLEADDVMGIWATHPDYAGKCIAVSQDKDMQTLPIAHWDGEGLVTYTEAEADYFHLYQTLIGDKTDGYPGCPGMGPVKAKKLLHDCTYCNWIGTPSCKCGPERGCLKPYAQWLAVVEAFKKAGLDEAEALKQARLARILRYEDWDNKEKKPILWQPTM
jgi:DNA polymerase I